MSAKPPPHSDITLPDPVLMTKSVLKIAEKSHKIVSEFLNRQSLDKLNTPVDPLSVGQTFLDLTTKMMTNPTKLFQSQMAFWNEYAQLCQHATQRFLSDQTEPYISPDPNDRRFKNPLWSDNSVFDFIKQSYLLTARWVQSLPTQIDSVDEKTKVKIDFYTRQFVDALAPTNFVFTNPEVLRMTVESNGENLVKGLDNILKDLEQSKEQFRISMTDYNAFHIGENLAVTPGKVIYQNQLMQLIQYTPTTPEVYQTPLLVIPPWINKYYIMDLQPKNSLIKWIVDQGVTVFLISWINPDETLAHKTFDDYMLEGPLAALEAIEKQTGEKTMNALGYCLGGTLLATLLSYMAAKKDARIKSATFFTSMIDFSEPGELGVFIDEEQLNNIEKIMEQKGYLDGSQMSIIFNMLRANDLIWSFVINNYLLGKDPFPFDLLYWNSDSTRMPAAMHGWYLRQLYQNNRLCQANDLTIGGQSIDIRKIKTPAFFLSTIEDHIAPWKSTYKGSVLFSGPVTFTLAASGHIAGVINPPVNQKYWYWSNKKNYKEPEKWLESAKKTSGSWWPQWHEWYKDFGGDKVLSRDPEAGVYSVIEDAPGAYVKVR